MYINKVNSDYILKNEKGLNSVARVCTPYIAEKGIEFELKEKLIDYKEQTAEYHGGGFSVIDKYTDLGGGLFLVQRNLCNEGDSTREFKMIFETETCFIPEKYLVPCINYDGNKWGEGKEPKGLECDGEPWIFAYDRVGIPSCTITETKDICFSIFASAGDKDSMRSCCSMIKTESGTIRQRIMWPVTEAPYTYSDNDKMVERYDEYMTLGAGECLTVQLYVLASVPRWENYGVTETLDRVLDIFPFDKKANLTPEQVWEYGISFIQSLKHECKGKNLFCTGISPTKDGFRYSPHFEIGWCGQNILNSRMFVLEYLKTGNKQLLDDAIAICDNWVEKQADNGLVLAHYEWYTNGREWNYKPRDYTKSWASNVDYKNGWLPETCNLGWAASEMIKLWDVLGKAGIDKSQYKEFAIKICDFFVEHYSEEFGFGKAWRFDGECEEKGGSIGGFITMALLDNYKILGDTRYLECAAKSLDFYFKRDLDNFVCTAGAIDCTCIDKETAGPFIIASIDMYEITGEDKYLQYALKAAYYFTSWMFHYDAYYGPESEFYNYGYYTSGGTSVSTQHPAIDQWGELMCSEFLRLYKITGDEKWRTRCLMMWHNSTQCITTDENQTVHGMKRPLGAQNEAFYHCRWGHRKDCNERGHLNDWLVSWVTSFRLTVLDRLTSVCGEADWSALE